MDWNALFDRAAVYEVSLEAIVDVRETSRSTDDQDP